MFLLLESKHLIETSQKEKY